jgi:hypothetical protein
MRLFDFIKINLREIGCEDVNCIEMAQGHACLGFSTVQFSVPLSEAWFP